MGASSLPSTPITGAVLYDIFSAFGANISLMTFCSLIPPFVGVLSVYVMYYIGKDYGGRTVGLLAALFLAVDPTIIERTSLGFFDTQVVGTLALVLFIFLFLRSLDANRSFQGSIAYSLSAGAALAYFIGGWGGAYYIIDLIALFAFVMIIIRRYSQRLLISYGTTFGLALFIATKIPYISYSYLISYSVLPVAAVFILLLLAEVLRNNISVRSKISLTIVILAAILGSFGVLFATGYIGRIAGKFDTVIDPFIRSTAAIISSVAEQQITSWGNIYVELGIASLFFLIGLYFVLRNPTNRNVFLLVFAITALYFSGSMVRLLAIFAPAFAVMAAIGILGVIKPFYTLLQETPRTLAKSKRRVIRVSKEYSGVAVFLIFLVLVTQFAFSPTQTGGFPRSVSGSYVPTAISASSLPIGGASLSQPVTAWLDALNYVKQNVPSNNIVVSWWDYGFWLSYLGNCTTLNDNTTENTTQIANVGFIMMGNENQSMQMLNDYNNYNNPGRVNYILVFTVLQIQQSGQAYVASPSGYGDEGKWIWMARISGATESRFMQEGLMNNQTSTVWKDEYAFGNNTGTNGQWVWNDQGENCTIYELMNYAEVQYCNYWTNQGLGITPSTTTTPPTYFTNPEIAGETTSPFQYGGLVPLVAIYKVDYPLYYAETGATGTGNSTSTGYITLNREAG